MSFEVHFPEGLRANISEKRLTTAIDRLRGAVEALVPAVLPWANRLTMSTEWSYRWWSEVDEIKLPKTSENTP